MDVKIMRSGIQPTSALPVTRNMPYHTASVPSRNQPRNMTGIYLGLVSALEYFKLKSEPWKIAVTLKCELGFYIEQCDQKMQIV